MKFSVFVSTALLAVASAVPSEVLARNVNEVDVARDVGSAYSAPGNLIARDDNDEDLIARDDDEDLENQLEDDDLEIQLEDNDGADNSTSPEMGLEARANGPSVKEFNCNYGEWADRRWVEVQNSYTRAYEWCTAGAAPAWTQFGKKGTCNRLGCHKGAEIWLCNDRRNYLKVHCSVIGGIVDEMIRKCFKWDGHFYSTKGQAFTTDDWNVIVTRVNNC